MHPDHDTLVSITNDLAHVHGGQSAPTPSNPFNISPGMLHQGLINTGTSGNVSTFQPVNCVNASQVLPGAPPALKDSYICTATEAPRTAVTP